MKVLLINLCLRRDTPKKIYPVGLGYVASAVYRAGFDVDILDIDIHRYSADELQEILRKRDFDVVGFGCIVTGYKIVKDLCATIRSLNRKAVIIVGNSVATSIPKLLLERTEADVAVMGEGDVTIVELLQALDDRKPLKRVAGICFKEGGQVLATSPREVLPDLDKIPFPEWDLFDMRYYVQESKNYVSEPYPLPKESIRAFPINTARGCVYKCTFCYHVFRANRYRFRTPHSIIAEIKTSQKRYGVNYVNFWDELTFFSKKQAEALCDAIISEDLGIYWTASARADLFGDDDIQLARKMKRAGCVGLGYSLESANAGILTAMHKHIRCEDFAAQKRVLDKAGIITWTSLVFGYPQETEETIRETMEFCYQNDIYPSAGYLLPQPGTPIYDYMLRTRLITDEEAYLIDMGDRQDLRMNLTGLPTGKMEALVREHLDKINV